MNRGLSFLGALLSIAILAGCGGGGGGGSKGSSGTGVLTLALSGDAGSASGPIGTAQHISIYRTNAADGDTQAALYDQTVDLSTGTKTIQIKKIPAGTLRLHVGLLDASRSAEIGAVDTTFEGGTAPAPIAIAMAQPVTHVAVTPTAGTANVGATALQLYPAALASDGTYVSTAPTAWTWTSATPTVATVSATGAVTGVAEGSSEVKASLVGTALSGSSTVGVLGSGVRKGKWTVMVYMDAANNLYDYALNNVNQMEQIANNPDVRFVIQWKQTADSGLASGQNWSGTRRYLAAYNNTSKIASVLAADMGAGVDMGSPAALTDFVDWTKTNYPADHYALVLWDHGSGWYDPQNVTTQPRLISIDDEFGSSLEPWELRSALLGRHFDILAYDACLMQGAEDLFENAANADYIVGSEAETPAPGYPYHKIFKPFVDSPDTDVPTLAKSFVTEFQDYYSGSQWVKGGWQIQQSVLQTSKLPAFRTALDSFGSTLLTYKSLAGPLMTNVRTSVTKYAGTSGYTYYDLDQICEQVQAKTSSEPIAAAAANLRAALSDIVLSTGTNTNAPYMKGLCIEFARAPIYNGSAKYASAYPKLQMAQFTSWDEFLSDVTANP